MAALRRSASLWRLDRWRTGFGRIGAMKQQLCDQTAWRSSVGIERNRGFAGLREFIPRKEIFPSAFVIPWRGLATARQVKMDFYMSSPGLIAEKYRPPPPPLPFFQRWFTRQGWRLKKKYLMDMLKTAYCLAKLRKKHKGYNQKVFYREATDLYKEINKLSAAGDLGKLRRLVTEHFFSVIKNQIKQRQAAYSRVHWEMVGQIKLMRTLQGRLIGIDRKDLDNAFVQITLRIQSNQIFAAYDKNNNIIKGDLEKPLLVEDIWIFEKHLTRPDSTWRLCGQLNF
ncbi:39S ribosomal protein L45, mitochondrial [Selaginella moellendorffii]|uniref:39S ribosomal protein L45, mitochondrial n=1 Tax=Selaginella moellendorffii TaxID=88036 RepID=UPI000D1CC78A|nr:39S ribosomal protein L45, mitochondrial [Selaginella moellendorffii]|eukprot:XP_024539238.1 39S ribosomal protein L45, mitochondrial [Selaginella moellendorffii]